jgi:hypothetical protein
LRVLLAIVHGVYKPTNITGGSPHCGGIVFFLIKISSWWLCENLGINDELMEFFHGISG